MECSRSSSPLRFPIPFSLKEKSRHIRTLSRTKIASRKNGRRADREPTMFARRRNRIEHTRSTPVDFGDNFSLSCAPPDAAFYFPLLSSPRSRTAVSRSFQGVFLPFAMCIKSSLPLPVRMTASPGLASASAFFIASRRSIIF